MLTTWHPLSTDKPTSGDRSISIVCLQTQAMELFMQDNKTLWPQSSSELYRPSDRRSSAKLVPTFADRGCHVVSVTNLYGTILGFLDQSSYFFFEVTPQIVLMRLSEPRSRPTTSQKMW
jgi:hypothetical protein